MKRTKLVLRKKVKETLLLILMSVVLGLIILACIINYNNTAGECDKAKGHLCSTYEIERNR